ncbi:hypothetical protein ACIBG0_38905 [Nocardia sp. NPDC050630]|uniref:hypothetical protein n=1 Tax=Nocardia sp. NPDC050630 TaxID=3364321 RepID=UPI0037ADDBA5
MRVEKRTSVEQDKSGTWLWIGSVSSYRADGQLASSVCRWGETGLTEEAARAAAAEWERTYQVAGRHAVPGLDGMGTLA